MNRTNITPYPALIAYRKVFEGEPTPLMIQLFSNLYHILHSVIPYGTVVAGITSAIAMLIQKLLVAVFGCL